ncbi:hypothetical protein [Tenacibaculum discolor]|uniref:hypothetical protein n=1 Tax=Tenacibaculum discolor TaxID=361581 RepID=UPI000EACAD3F|nr:hypothetical protein [Tenacibaculum discolor]RLK00215.1 hypothetical protein C8N27_1902 [Tenacibaculum discolor]
MKFLKNSNVKVLSNLEQKEINGGGDGCRQVSSLSGMGCTTVSYDCYSDNGWKYRSYTEGSCGGGRMEVVSDSYYV